MIRKRLGTIRGQLVVWYLSVLAILLLVLGIVQAITLTGYLRSTTALTMRDSARSELRSLGPCYVQSPHDLTIKSQRLAGLLGSHDVAVKIVRPSGVTLADHGFGFPGQYQPLQLSAATIHQLIGGTHVPTTSAAPLFNSGCSPEAFQGTGFGLHAGSSPSYPLLTQGDLVLTAVPIGPFGHPVGFALLGRSFSDAGATIRRTELIFGIGALVALVLAALVALPIINRALRPLRRVSGTAEAIAAGDFSQRANLSHSADEIGRLGSAFDAMVDRLQAALSSAHESETRMRRFLADASHELRTPLTVLRGMSEVLLRQKPARNAEMARGLEDLHEEAVRLSRLVDDLLTLTRLDAGQSLTPERVQLRPFLEEFTERYGSAWPDRRVELELDALDGGAAFVEPDALRRILTNLIDNAARYSMRERPITVSASPNGETVTVAVRDAGPGLTPEDAERVFERFYRGAKSRSRSSGGSGLGLAIVRALAHGSGGDVEIDTAPDRGTTISVTLPQPPEDE